MELPAVNTPQFDWCRTTMDHSPQPVGKVYQPEVIARATRSRSLSLWANMHRTPLLVGSLALLAAAMSASARRS